MPQASVDERGVMAVIDGTARSWEVKTGIATSLPEEAQWTHLVRGTSDEIVALSAESRRVWPTTIGLATSDPSALIRAAERHSYKHQEDIGGSVLRRLRDSEWEGTKVRPPRIVVMMVSSSARGQPLGGRKI